MRTLQAAKRSLYQVYVDVYDGLEVSLFCNNSPYAGGEEKVFLVTNNRKYDIPVITVKYYLWDRNT